MSGSSIAEINRKIHEQILIYAAMQGITYEEAASRVEISVGGIKLQPCDLSKIIVNIEVKS